jgi:hypothetical protein
LGNVHVPGLAEAGPSAKSETDEVSSPLLPKARPYTAGRWRLANPAILEDVKLWVSHLLIRHEEVFGTQVCVGPPGWHAFPPPPRRTRAEALSIATGLAMSIQDSPQKFVEIAREYSEDTVTRDTGGSFGGITASEFLRTPEILDALSSMQPGEISRVIETHCGFHIIHRRSVPPIEMVSGTRIVIGHDGAGWLRRFGARRSIPSRARGDALVLANKVYERARARPDRFSELVREYSEHRDAIDDGEIGEWSTHESSAIPREVEILQGLRDGEIAPPVEGLFGFEVIRRTSPRARKHFSIEAIQFFFDAEAPEDGLLSKNTAFKKASDAINTLAVDPSAWSRLRSDQDCEDVETWTEGRAPCELETLLERLAPGEITNRPVEWNSGFVIAKVIDPSRAPPAALPQHDLPAPVAPDIDYFSGQMHSGMMQEIFRSTCEDSRTRLHLSDEEAKALQDLHNMASQELVSEVQRRDEFIRIQRQVENQLGNEGYARYQQAMAKRFEDVVLSRNLNLRRFQ